MRGGGVRKSGVNELETAFGADDGLLELGDFAVELVDSRFATDERFSGVGHGLHFTEFGREGAGFIGVIDEGEVPLDGDADVEALDLPAGDGDVADGGEGELVDGLIDFDELFEELIVLGAVFIAEDGRVRRDEMGELLYVLAGFDGVGTDFGFACIADWTLGLGAVLAGGLCPMFVGAFFFGQIVILF